MHATVTTLEHVKRVGSQKCKATLQKVEGNAYVTAPFVTTMHTYSVTSTAITRVKSHSEDRLATISASFLLPYWLAFYLLLAERKIWMERVSFVYLQLCANCTNSGKYCARMKIVPRDEIITSTVTADSIRFSQSAAVRRHRGPVTPVKTGEYLLIIHGRLLFEVYRSRPKDPNRSHPTRTVAEAIIIYWVVRFGVPGYTHSDQESHFEMTS